MEMNPNLKYKPSVIVVIPTNDYLDNKSGL